MSDDSRHQATFHRIFEVLDEIRERVTKVETSGELWHAQNEADHNNLTSLVLEVRKDVEVLMRRDAESSGRRGVVKSLARRVWEVVIALLSCGALTSIILKQIGVL